LAPLTTSKSSRLSVQEGSLEQGMSMAPLIQSVLAHLSAQQAALKQTDLHL